MEAPREGESVGFFNFHCVALADKCWKGKRVEALEETIVAWISKASGTEPWECYSKLDEIVQSITSNADARSAWQMSFPVE
jgi:hypothetical protein